jgi:hypothetical protein
MVLYNGFWDPKMYPYSFKEELGSGFFYDVLLVGN